MMQRTAMRLSRSNRLLPLLTQSLGHALLLLAALCVAEACERAPAGVDGPALQKGSVEFRASIQSPAVSTLVTEVTGQGIPDPLVFNSELTGTDTDGDGAPDEFSASDVLVVPAGASRLFTVRAFDGGGVQTHEGSATTSVVPGPNALAVVITLQPLTGEKPIQVVLGRFDVTVTPEAEMIVVGATQSFTAAVSDQNGPLEGATVRWATSNPGVATVDGDGLATGRAGGTARIVATWMGVGAEGFLTVNVSRIAFRSQRSGNNDIWAVQVDPIGVPMGTPVQVTTGAASDRFPTWSPDRPRIAFESDRSGNNDIWVLMVDRATGAPAGIPVQVTSDAASDRFPAWSPDGSRIAFSSDRSGTIDIWVVEVDPATGAPAGTPVQVTTNTAADRIPAWSPDGARIAFSSDRSGNSDIWMVEVDPTGAPAGAPVQVTTDAALDGSPAWSPDGTRIAFRSDRSGNADIWVVEVDPTGAPTGAPVQVTTDAADDRTPAWSPDGTHLVFRSGRAGQSDLWVVELYPTGTPTGAPVRVTTDPAIDAEPAWTPY